MEQAVQAAKGFLSKTEEFCRDCWIIALLLDQKVLDCGTFDELKDAVNCTDKSNEAGPEMAIC